METNLVSKSGRSSGSLILKLIISLLFILYCSTHGWCQSISPNLYYTFDETAPLGPTVGTGTLTTAGYYTTPAGGQVGKYMYQDSSVCGGFATSGVLANTTGFTVMFMVKLGRNFDSSRDPYVFQWGTTLLRWYYPQIWFATSRTSGTTVTSTNSQLPPLGSGQGVDRSAWGYLHDEEWHHIAISYNPATGYKKLYVDGLCANGFFEVVPLGGTVTQGASQRLIFNGSTSSFQKAYMCIDEIAVWNQAISDAHVYQAYSDAMDGQHYTFAPATNVPSAPGQVGVFDIDEYPQGYVLGSTNSSGVTKWQTHQLKTYPLPRYKPGHSLYRMPAWLQPNYLAGQTNQGLSTTVLKDTIQAIDLELAVNWNHYLPLSWHLQNESNSYANTSKLSSVLITQANAHPELPVSVIGYHNQMRPTLAGFALDTGYCEAKGLPASHYLKNGSGQWLSSSGSVTTNSNQKVLSPIAPPDSLRQDGLAMKYYLESKLIPLLTRPIDYYGENNEAIPVWSQAAMSNDPLVSFNKTVTGLSWDEYAGKKAFDIHQIYKGEFINTLVAQNANVIYDQYYVMAYDGVGSTLGDREYWRQYRQILSPVGGRYLSTIDYYPRRPGNWNVTSGPFKGWSPMVDNLNATIAEQDSFFIPFVSAGWHNSEEVQMRPAQFLGNLKNLMGLGAMSFKPAFFSLAAPFPDPRGWVWQAAYPSYANALLSYVPWYLNSKVLTGDDKYDPQKSINGYQYYAGRRDNTVVVRQNKTDTDKYLITSCLQRYTNSANERNPEENVTIRLNSKDVTFNSRIQGSVYVLDFDDTLMYQLDGWHEYSHPDKWSHDVQLEAELVDAGTFSMKTYGNTGYNFSNAFTAVTWKDTATVFDTLKYTFQIRETKTLYVWVRARSRTGTTTSAKVWLDNGAKDTIGNITSTSWYWYRYKYNQTVLKLSSSVTGDVDHVFKMQANNKHVEIDRVLLTEDPNISFPEPVTVCVLSASIVAPVTAFCNGGYATLTASPSGAGYSYVWSTGATSAAIAATASATYTVTVYDGAGCSGSASQAITEYPDLVDPEIISADDISLGICQGDTIDIGIVNEVYAIYAWNTGAITDVIQVSAAGLYACTVTDFNGCTYQSNGFTVTVRPTIIPRINRLSPTTICYDSSATFSCTTTGLVAWNWFGRDSTASAGSNDTLITDSLSVVHLVGTDIAGCRYLSPDTFTIRKFRCDTCEQPRGTAAGGVTATAATISWGFLTNAIRFEVKVQDQRTMRVYTNAVEPIVRTSRFKGLKASTPYKYWVVAICSNGDQYSSVKRNFTTLRY